VTVQTCKDVTAGKGDVTASSSISFSRHITQRRSDCQIHRADLQIPTPIPVGCFEIYLSQNDTLGDDNLHHLHSSAPNISKRQMFIYTLRTQSTRDFGVSFWLVSQFHNRSFETSVPPLP
jgi:hypothetical protein